MGIEAGKRAAAEAAVDLALSVAGGQDKFVLGIGSGSTVVYAVAALKQKCTAIGMNLVCVPTSFQAQQLIMEANLTLGDLNQNPSLDLAIDGADEVDARLNCIKGGGGCLLQEKVVASSAKRLILIADDRKKSEHLGVTWRKGVPVEVVPFAYVPIKRKIEALGATVALRMAKAKAGPCVTDNGNVILDCDFGTISDPAQIEHDIAIIPGVVETGIFLAARVKTWCAFFGSEDGSVTKLEL